MSLEFQYGGPICRPLHFSIQTHWGHIGIIIKLGKYENLAYSKRSKNVTLDIQ